jgi:cytochrome c556
MAKILKGRSPFDDGGILEVIEEFPEDAKIPMLRSFM